MFCREKEIYTFVFEDTAFSMRADLLKDILAEIFARASSESQGG